MVLVRAFRIPVQTFRGGVQESSHTVLAASCGMEAHSRYEVGLDSLPAVWMRSTAKPFQLLPLLSTPDGSALMQDPRDLAVCVSSHDGTPEHASRVHAILQRHGLGREWLRCGVHRPYFLQRLDAQSPQHGEPYDELNNNCSGNHTVLLLWARACGVPLESYLDPESEAQAAIERLIGAASGATPVKSIDNCGSPCYQLPLGNLAQAYLGLASQQAAQSWVEEHADALRPWGSAASVVEHMQRIGAAMATHPRWVSGAGTEASRLSQRFPGVLVIKHGAEGVLCVAHRQERASLALKVLDGNARALFPALLQLMQDFGWCDIDSETLLTSLARPELKGPPGHRVGTVCAAEPSPTGSTAGDAPTPAV